MPLRDDAEVPRPDDAEVLVDATGLRCPMPVIRLAATAKQAQPGTVITLLSTDPAAEPDVAAWCRMRGHQLLDQTWLDQESPNPTTARTLRSRVKTTPS